MSLPSKAFTIYLVPENPINKESDKLRLCFGHGLALAHKTRQAVINFASRIESKYGDVAKRL
jgi:hypothetical protein